MKKICVAFISVLITISLGCGETRQIKETAQPTLKSEKSKEEITESTICNFSTQIMTTSLPEEIGYHPVFSRIDSDKSIYFLLGSKTALEGRSYWRQVRTPIPSNWSKRQKEVCQQLENQFSGYDNARYRRHSYIEEYSLAHLKESTKAANTDEYIEIKPEKSDFILEYADPRPNTSESIQLRRIAVNIQCKEPTMVNANYLQDIFKFKHGKKCEFTAFDQEFKLNSKEVIKVSISGALENTRQSERNILSVNKISWRD